MTLHGSKGSAQAGPGSNWAGVCCRCQATIRASQGVLQLQDSARSSWDVLMHAWLEPFLFGQ